MFEPDETVVCIDDNFAPQVVKYVPERPVANQMYVVRDIVPGIEPNGKATVTVYLKELVNPPNLHGIEPGFHVTRFRRLLPTEEHLLAINKQLQPQSV